MAASRIVGGLQAKSAADQQAAQYKYEAKQAQEDYKLRRVDRRKQMERTIAQQMSEMGARGGVDLGSQLYLDTTAEFAQEDYEDRIDTQRQARRNKISAKNAKQSGTNALVRSGLTAATDLFSYGIKRKTQYED